MLGGFFFLFFIYLEHQAVHPEAAPRISMSANLPRKMVSTVSSPHRQGSRSSLSTFQPEKANKSVFGIAVAVVVVVWKKLFYKKYF